MQRLTLWLAYAEVIICICGVLAVLILFVMGEIEQTMIFIRALVIIPFGLWWGLKQIRREAKAKQLDKE